jgi:hypothetical protein
MSTYSPNLELELIGTGDQPGAWGETTNINLGTLIEQAISGYVTQTISDSGDTVITIPAGAYGVARNMCLELIGTLTAQRNLIVPANKKLYFINNNTDGGFGVVVKVSGQTGVLVGNGESLILVSDGTDIYSAVSYARIAGGAVVVASGGTGVTTLSGIAYGNGTSPFTAATAAQVVATIGSTPVAVATTALNIPVLTTTNYKIEQVGNVLQFSSFPTFTASIAAFVMTVTTATAGSLIYGQTLSGTGVVANTTLGIQKTSTETTAASVVYVSGGAVGAVNFVVTSVSGIARGQMISGIGVPDGTYVSPWWDGTTTITLVNYLNAPVAFTIQAAGTYIFAAAGGKGVYAVSTSQTVASTTITGTKLVANMTFNGTFNVTS